ncbi:MAG: hypothetical protein Q8O45_09190 [Desulfurivibrionaceae bacterium]|nr:hypothetical protein [Desulfurivibrionaceae bacterium]
MKSIHHLFCCCTVFVCIFYATGSKADNLITQSHYGQGSINITLFNPEYRLSFKSQPLYTGSLAPFSQLDNPNYLVWLKMSGAPRSTKRSVSPELAYTRFLQGKAQLEQDPCITRPPVFLLSSNENAPDSSEPKCLSYQRLLSAINTLDESIAEVPNAWSRLYLGLAYARLRAFTSARKELFAAEHSLKQGGQIEAAEFARQYGESVWKWQKGNDNSIKGKIAFECPDTPEKTREALGQPMGICTLLFCGAWEGHKDIEIRRKVIPGVLQKALGSLHNKSHRKIAASPIFQCAAKIDAKDDDLQAQIDMIFLDFVQREKYDDPMIAKRYFRLEHWFVEKGRDEEALKLLQANLPMLIRHVERGDMALAYATRRESSLITLRAQLNILGFSGQDREVFEKLRLATDNLAPNLDILSQEIEHRFRVGTAGNLFLTADSILSILRGDTNVEDELRNKVFAIISKLSQDNNEDLSKRLLDEVTSSFQLMLSSLISCPLPSDSLTSFSNYQNAMLDAMALPAQAQKNRAFSRWWRNRQPEFDELIRSRVENSETWRNLATGKLNTLKTLGLYYVFNISVGLQEQGDRQKIDSLIKTIPAIIELVEIEGKSSRAQQLIILEKSTYTFLDSFLLPTSDSFDEEKNESITQVVKKIFKTARTCDLSHSEVECRYSEIDLLGSIVQMYTRIFLPPDAPDKLQDLLAFIERRTRQIASTRVNESVPLGQILIQSLDAAITEVIDGHQSIRLSKDDKLLLGLSLMALRNSELDKNKKSAPIRNLFFGKNILDEWALSIGSLCQPKQFQKYFTPKQIQQFRNLPALACLLSQPIVLSNFSPEDLKTVFAHMRMLAGHNEIVIQSIVVNTALYAASNSQMLSDQLGYQRIHFLASLASPSDHGLRLQIPLEVSDRWMNLIGKIEPEFYSQKTRTYQAVIKCSFSSYSSCWFEVDTANYLDRKEVQRNAKLSLIRAASREPKCDTLSAEFVSSETKLSSIDMAVAVGKILQRDDCPSETEQTALSWAEALRYQEGLPPDDRIPLLRGLVPKPFLLREIRLAYSGDIGENKLMELFEMLALKTGAILSEDILIAAATRLAQAKLCEEVIYQLDGDILQLDIRFKENVAETL